MFLIEKQQEDKNVPTYFDNRIQSIPVKDSGEELVDLFQKKGGGVKMLNTPEIPFSDPTLNVGFKCSSFVRKSLYDRLEALAYFLKKFSKNPNLSVAVYEGLRDMDTQKKLFESCEDELTLKYTDLSKKEISELTEKTVAKVSPHSTGACVDLRVFDEEKQEFLDMGKFGYYWGDNPQAFTFCVGLYEEQKKNRHLLLSSAATAGLVNYPLEWWHFSFGDQYFAYYTENKYAIYNNI